MIFFGMGVVGSALAIAWSATVRRSWPDKDTVLGLIKVFMSMAFVAMAVAVLARYVF